MRKVGKDPFSQIRKIQSLKMLSKYRVTVLAEENNPRPNENSILSIVNQKGIKMKYNLCTLSI